jgi:4-hydroxy-2-oxoheptanedioate aldolase
MDKVQIKTRASKGDCIFGAFVRIPEPTITEILGYSGLDFVVIDMEHGPMSNYHAESIVRAAQGTNIASFIRVRENSETMILRALDTGASGIQIPQINTVSSAQNAVRASHFYPKGFRGVCRFTRNAEYSKIPVGDYFNKSNDNTLVILQIEGTGGVDNIDKILEVPGIDVIFLGPYDLSQAIGLTGQVGHPEVLKIIEKITKKARDKKIAVASFADNLRFHLY